MDFTLKIELYDRHMTNHIAAKTLSFKKNKAKEDYKPEKNGPGLTRSTSACAFKIV